jgi:hypothetical protein
LWDLSGDDREATTADTFAAMPEQVARLLQPKTETLTETYGGGKASEST